MAANCCIKGCEKPVVAKGMCSMHYTRVRAYGDPTYVKLKQVLGATLAERFEHYVDKSGDCWLWTSSKDRNGYGRLQVNGTPRLAHRIAWELFRGPITPQQHVLHRCDNPPCVNPDHLFLGDQAANNADMRAKNRFHPGVSKGEAHGCAKLTDEQVLAIRASVGPSRVVALQYGVSGRQVRDIRTRKSWKHIP